MSHGYTSSFGSVLIADNFEASLLDSLPVKEAAFQAATAIAAKVRATAPVDTGTYLASIGVEEFRGGARVVSDDPVAHIIEFGAPHRKAENGGPIEGRFIFHNAAKALGFKFRSGK